MDQLIQELAENQQSVTDLGIFLPEKTWDVRKNPGSWSVAECIIHLNITSETYLPLLKKTMDEGRKTGHLHPPGGKLDFWGWALCTLLEPPYKRTSKTPAAFEPGILEDKETVLRRFGTLQEELMELVRHNADLNWNRLTIASPFNAKISYNVYSAVRVLAVHQRRHIWQAKKAMV